MKQNKTLIIGLTGGIATGKSTISEMFREKGINVIDADIISREVLDIYPDVLSKIKDTFGHEYILGKGIDRKKLGMLVFSDKEEREKLEKIIIPYIKQEIYKRVDNCKAHGDNIIIVDAPTLFENNLDKDMNKVILVYLDEELQIMRLMERDELSEQEAEDRISVQLPLDEKKKKSDYVIYNNRDMDFLEEQFNKLFRELEDETKKED